jgi:hypothetical protein
MPERAERHPCPVPSGNGVNTSRPGQVGHGNLSRVAKTEGPSSSSSVSARESEAEEEEEEEISLYSSPSPRRRRRRRRSSHSGIL